MSTVFFAPCTTPGVSGAPSVPGTEETGGAASGCIIQAAHPQHTRRGQETLQSERGIWICPGENEPVAQLPHCHATENVGDRKQERGNCFIRATHLLANQKAGCLLAHRLGMRIVLTAKSMLAIRRL